MEKKTEENIDPLELSKLTSLVIDRFERKTTQNHEEKITVNPVVAKFATWYEKFRNAMEYREEEVILRAAIERILRRRLLLGGTGKTTAESLVREIVWARYLPDNMLPESIIQEVEDVIDLYLALRLKILELHRIPQGIIDEWTYHLMSSELENLLSPSIEKETISNYMFQVLKNHVEIVDDSEQTRDAQVYIAVRKTFARDDIAFLRFHLFKLYFGNLQKNTVEKIAKDFLDGYREIEKELRYVRKDRIHSYIKKKAAAFFILEEVLSQNKGRLRDFLTNEESLSSSVLDTCSRKYKGISQKIRRAIIRSVLFILLTKVIFAFAVEGTYERIFYGEVLWNSILLNTSMPPILMIIVSMFIKTPGEENSKRILSVIKELAYREEPRLDHKLVVQKNKKNRKPILNGAFSILWFLAFVLSFGGIVLVLTRLQFNIISQMIFIFFLAIVSFLSYRISLLSKLYTYGDRQNVFTPVVDFLFMPVVRVGQRLTLSVSKINILLFIFDFIIETPFKIVFGFAEQWFRFLHDKREEIG